MTSIIGNPLFNLVLRKKETIKSRVHQKRWKNFSFILAMLTPINTKLCSYFIDLHQIIFKYSSFLPWSFIHLSWISRLYEYSMNNTDSHNFYKTSFHTITVSFKWVYFIYLGFPLHSFFTFLRPVQWVRSGSGDSLWFLLQ